MQDHMRGADGQRYFVPLAVSQSVGEGLCVGLLALGPKVEAHLIPLPAALQLQEPGEEHMTTHMTIYTAKTRLNTCKGADKVKGAADKTRAKNP